MKTVAVAAVLTTIIMSSAAEAAEPNAHDFQVLDRLGRCHELASQPNIPDSEAIWYNLKTDYGKDLNLHSDTISYMYGRGAGWIAAIVGIKKDTLTFHELETLISNTYKGICNPADTFFNPKIEA